MLDENSDSHRPIFEFFMKKLDNIMNEIKYSNFVSSNSENGYQKNNDLSKNMVLLTVSIRGVGFFSKAIKNFLGEDQLRLFLNKLLSISEGKVIKYYFVFLIL